MKGFFATLALAIVPALAIPITEQAEAVEAPFTVSQADTLPNHDDGVAWLFTATDGPKVGKGAALKFYQRNDLVKSGKGQAWVLEIDDSIDTQNSELAKVSRQVRPERERGGRRGKRTRQGEESAPSAVDGSAQGGGISASLPDLSSIPIIGGLLGKASAPAAEAAPSSSSGGSSIAELTTQIGEQIGTRVGEPIGSAIGSRIGKAVGTPIGKSIGGAIGNAIQGLLPA